MICAGCGNQKAYYTQQSGEDPEMCDLCGASPPSVYDVFLPHIGWKSDQLIDKNGQPVEFLSHGHKARFLKENGLAEAGDRHHGAPLTSMERQMRVQDPAQRRAEVRDAVARARNEVLRKARR